MRLIQLSDLIVIIQFALGPHPQRLPPLARSLAALVSNDCPLGELSAKQRQDERQKDTQDDRCRQRKIETEVSAADDDVAGESADREADHHEEAEGGYAETHE